jgi:hypothetical protein
MARLLAGKISALVAILTTSVIISGCGTTSGAPEICKPNSKLARCAKVVKKQPVKVAKIKKTRNVAATQKLANNY